MSAALAEHGGLTSDRYPQLVRFPASCRSGWHRQAFERHTRKTSLTIESRWGHHSFSRGQQRTPPGSECTVPK